MMCSSTPRKSKVAFSRFAFCLLFLSRATIAEDFVWEKAFWQARQLREQGLYAEAEKAHLLALAEAEKLVPEDRRLASSLSNLATLYHTTARLSEAEPLYRRALLIWERLSDP